MTPKVIEQLAREAGFQCLDLKLGADYEPIKLIQPVSSTNIAVELQRFAALVLERAADHCEHLSGRDGDAGECADALLDMAKGLR